MIVVLKKQDGTYVRFTGAETLTRISDGEELRMAVGTAKSWTLEELGDVSLHLALGYVPTPGMVWDGEGETFEEVEGVLRQIVDEVLPPPPPTADETLDKDLTDRPTLDALLRALNDGTFIPGSNYPNGQLRQKLKDKMSQGGGSQGGGGQLMRKP